MFIAGRALSNKGKYQSFEMKGGVSSVHSALYGLFAFILAFAFSLSGQRYDYTRSVLIDESNAIGTAVLRCDLYKDSTRNILREDFRKYLDARISMYEAPKDLPSVISAMRITDSVGKHIWNLVTYESKQPNMLIPSNQMIPALNEMFDMGSKRDMLLRTNVPDLIIYMVLILALCSSFLSGVTALNIIGRDRLIFLFFMIFSTIVIYITLDMGRPLRGVIKADVAEQAIIEIRHQLDPEWIE